MTIVNIILTGASGFLGQHLICSFLKSNTVPNDDCHYKVFALFHTMDGFREAAAEFSTSIASEQSPRVVVEQVGTLDLTNEQDIQTWVANYQRQTEQNQKHVCVHTAALSVPRSCESDPERAKALNVPTHLFDLLSTAVPTCYMIALSTDQVYAGDPTKAPYTEEDVAQPCNVYGKTKLDMEEYVLQTAFPGRSVALRSSIILGPKAPLLPEQAHSTFLHFIASRNGLETSFFTDECRSVIFVDDVLAVIHCLIRNHLSATTTTALQIQGIYNMGGPEQRVSRYDMAVAVFQQLRYDTKYLIEAKKAGQEIKPGDVKSPLDISMTSAKLQTLSKHSFTSLSEMVQRVFPRE